MDGLLEKYNEFKSIANYRLVYVLENNQRIEVKLKQTDFPHLIGLHKLDDIPVIRKFNDPSNKTISAKYLISKIKQQNILTEAMIKSSRKFNVIEDRYKNFCKDNILTVSYTDAIVDFNADMIRSSLKSDYILFEERNNGYNYLCVAQNEKGKRYVESFFHNPRDLYVKGQEILKIKRIEIYNEKGALYLEDTLL